MVFQLAVLVLIPVIIGIVSVPTFDSPNENIEEITPRDFQIPNMPDRDLIYFFLMLVWLFFLIRILFQIKKGTFKIQRKF